MTSKDKDPHLCMNVFNYDFVSYEDIKLPPPPSSPLYDTEMDWNEDDYPYYEVC